MFAPIISFELLLLLVSKFLSVGRHVYHADISSALSHGDIDGELHVSCDIDVYKQKKCLSGLNQSARLWYEKVKKMLEGFGLEQHVRCKCISKVKLEKFHIVTLVYADGFVKTELSDTKMSLVKNNLRSIFNLMYLKIIRHYLEATFEQKRTVMTQRQAGYCRQALEYFGMDKTKSALNYLNYNIDNLFYRAVFSTAGKNSNQGFAHRKLLRSLLHPSTHTTPNIKLAEDILNSFVKCPLQFPWCAAKRATRYLARIINHRIIVGNGRREGIGLRIESLGLYAYSDSECARVIEFRKCTSGYALLF